jgi:hypothetical protein
MKETKIEGYVALDGWPCHFLFFSFCVFFFRFFSFLCYACILYASVVSLSCFSAPAPCLSYPVATSVPSLLFYYCTQVIHFYPYNSFLLSFLSNPSVKVLIHIKWY